MKSGRNFGEFGFDRGWELLFAVEEDSSVIVVELLLEKTRNSVFRILLWRDKAQPFLGGGRVAAKLSGVVEDQVLDLRLVVFADVADSMDSLLVVLRNLMDNANSSY